MLHNTISCSCPALHGLVYSSYAIVWYKYHKYAGEDATNPLMKYMYWHSEAEWKIYYHHATVAVHACFN